MKQSKIEVGQCYEHQDHVYMVEVGPFRIGKDKNKYYFVTDTLTKARDIAWPKSFILKLRRPFDNCG